MLDRHAVLELVRAKLTAHDIAKQLGVSVRTVRRIVREGEVATGDDAAARIARHVGRPQVTQAIRARVQALVLEDPERPPGEICREGYWSSLREKWRHRVPFCSAEVAESRATRLNNYSPTYARSGTMMPRSNSS